MQSKRNYTNEEIDLLSQKVEQLENQSQITVDQIEFLLELVKIISETNMGQPIINRASNRQRLNKLKSIVLPRRKRALIQIDNDDNMPEVIKDELILEQIRLIKKAIKDIHHREKYEEMSLKNFQQLSDNLLNLQCQFNSKNKFHSQDKFSTKGA